MAHDSFICMTKSTYLPNFGSIGLTNVLFYLFKNNKKNKHYICLIQFNKQKLLVAFGIFFVGTDYFVSSLRSCANPRYQVY